MRIVVDAMGGDFAPREIVRGAVEAALRLPSVASVILVGRPDAIHAELLKCGVQTSDRIIVSPASETIDMNEAPVNAVRRKKDSSISKGMDMVRDGKADAFVSAGNTGAVVAAATLKLRLIPGVYRPAIATVIPTRQRPFLLLDAGATTDCDAELLTQFAVMGSVFAEHVLHRKNPVVGLLSIGGEEIKGNETTKKAFADISRLRLSFRGNVEGHDLFVGETDVVVCDGFVGNVVLKTTESLARAFGFWLKHEFTLGPVRKLGALLLRGALRAMKNRMDPELYGGAPLLGVRGICIITHGASSHRAIFNAVRVASESVHQHVNDQIESCLAEVGA